MAELAPVRFQNPPEGLVRLVPDQVGVGQLTMPADERMGPMTIGRLLGIACNPMPSERQERLLATAIRDMPDWGGLEPALSVHRPGLPGR